MREVKTTINSKEYPVYYFDVPMMHDDFHTAEDNGLVYVGYDRHGPDYWDDCMVFCKKENYNVVNKWQLSCW